WCSSRLRLQWAQMRARGPSVAVHFLSARPGYQRLDKILAHRKHSENRNLPLPPHRLTIAVSPVLRASPAASMREDQLRQVLDCGIVAVVRSPDSEQLVEVARALADGGVRVVEITMSVPNALDVLRRVRQVLGDRVLLGAGTVLDPETARAVLLAGAEFIVAPTLNLDVIRLCRRYDKVVMPGAFTPTEIL